MKGAINLSFRAKTEQGEASNKNSPYAFHGLGFRLNAKHAIIAHKIGGNDAKFKA